jgi:hypothetical protein
MNLPRINTFKIVQFRTESMTRCSNVEPPPISHGWVGNYIRLKERAQIGKEKLDANSI